MSGKYERIQDGNDTMISTVLKHVLVLCFGHLILSWQYVRIPISLIQQNRKSTASVHEINKERRLYRQGIAPTVS